MIELQSITIKSTVIIANQFLLAYTMLRSLHSFSLSPGKHTAPVWQIKWIEKERGSGEETAEVLVSISTDGRVCQWSIRKGFECYGKLGLSLTIVQTCFYLLTLLKYKFLSSLNR